MKPKYSSLDSPSQDIQKMESGFSTLCETIARLRSSNGCPWDRKQTFSSLTKYLQEESQELIEALEDGEPGHICEEIGDVLFLLILLSTIGSENGHFGLPDVITGINAKMIHRHPHVFAGLAVSGEEELQRLWEKIKSSEQKKKTN